MTNSDDPHDGVKSCPFLLLVREPDFPILLSLIVEIKDKQLKSNEDFVWQIEVPLTGKFIIDVEFLDLKTASPNVRLKIIIGVGVNNIIPRLISLVLIHRVGNLAPFGLKDSHKSNQMPQLLHALVAC